MERRRAFTLVELMVVMIIITVLASLILPSVRKAREQSQRVACMSNLRQVTQAFTAYANDHDGQFLCPDSPDAQAGISSTSDQNLVVPALYPYVRSARVFHCPTDPRDNSVSYSPNEIFNGTWPYVHPLRGYSNVMNAASTFAMIEEFDLHPKAGFNGGGFVVVAAPAQKWIDTPAIAHGNGSCLTFADGHCEYWVWTDPRTLAFPAGTHFVGTSPNPDLARLQAVLGGN